MARKQTSSGQQNNTFRKALALSGVLHLSVILLFSLGMPFLHKPPQTPERVNVTLVNAENVAERAKAPASGVPDKSDDTTKPRGEPRAESEPERPPKQMEPVRPPQAPRVDMSKPPEPQQLEHTSGTKPSPGPAPRKPAPPEPEAESDSNDEEQKQKQKKKAQDKKDAEKTEKQFQSVLKNLAEPRPAPEKEKKDKESKKDKTEDKDKAGKARQQSLANRAGEVTKSEKQALREQLSQCWNVPVAVKDAEDLVIRLRLHMNRNRTVQQVQLLNKAGDDNNTQFRAAAESARRAVQKCSPLKLPLEKYDQWKEITVRFDPEEML